MVLILERLGMDEKALIHKWYREDMNALPSEYLLQPRGGDYLPREMWKPEEDSLRAILRHAVAKPDCTEEQKVKYFVSATHQEIMRGTLNAPPAKNFRGSHRLLSLTLHDENA
jgi:hypothetical protein